jgi:glycosyltransferase involved in cell wall biosynthesis
MLGFLVKTYPKISETFVLQEILALQSESFGLNIFSMQRPTDDSFHQAFESVSAGVDYLTPGDWKRPAAVMAHLWFLTVRPWAYWMTLAFTLNRAEGGTVGDFCQAVYSARLAQARGVRHFHSHFATAPAGLAELIQRLCGIGYSISAHAKDIYLNDTTALRRKIGNARFVVTCTEYNLRYLQSITQSDTPIVRVYHGIDQARMMAENDRRPADCAMPRILSVGRLRKKKGFLCLIEACRRLVEAGYRFQCDIVGYGPDWAKLATLIDRSRLTGIVRLCGKMTHGELVALYRRTAVFVLPCRIDEDGDRNGIPNVLMEAMTFSIPVVSTQVSGIPELIEEGRSGLLVEPDNPAALFEVLQRLLDRPGLRRRLGEAGKERVVATFAAPRHIGRLKELLADALLPDHSTHHDEATAGGQYGR